MPIFRLQRLFVDYSHPLRNIIKDIFSTNLFLKSRTQIFESGFESEQVFHETKSLILTKSIPINSVYLEYTVFIPNTGFFDQKTGFLDPNTGFLYPNRGFEYSVFFFFAKFWIFKFDAIPKIRNMEYKKQVFQFFQKYENRNIPPFAWP